jgi:hypothetical protein
MLFFRMFSPTAYAAERVQYDDIYEMTADPSTSRFAEYFTPATLDNGRLWADKSVSANSETFYNIDGKPLLTVDSEKDEFLVTMSTLSQSYTIETVVEPTDAVFIIDVSASMDIYKLGNVSRATVMVGALNDAIHTIMDANPNNRVAVVAYGGYASKSTNYTRTYQILKLDHYDITGDYFSISGNRITVNKNIGDEFVTSREISVEGGTPTQRGIYAGARILAENTDKEFQFKLESGRLINLTRQPALILLSDGDPTFGWSNYKIEGNDTDGGYDRGNGNPNVGDMGIDVLTVSTASYWKQRVQDNYYGGISGKNVKFYTIGVGVSGNHAPSVLDPETNSEDNSQLFQSVTYNMKRVLDIFVSPNAQVTFPALTMGSNTNRSLIQIKNEDQYIKSYDYTGGYYSADDPDTLDDAFTAIASEIVSKGTYTTEADVVNPDFSGYLIMSDVIGEHMKFRSQKGVLSGDDLYYGRNFARKITRDRSGEDWDLYMEVFSERLGVSAETMEEIVENNIAGGSLYYNSDTDFSNAVKWYADADTEYVGQYFDSEGNVNPPPDEAWSVVELRPIDETVYNDAADKYTNLIYSYLSVTTAIKPGVYGLKGHASRIIPMIEGQQIVRWYIPASLIPLRTVREKYDTENPDLVTGFEVKETLPIRMSYTVALEDGFDPASISNDYKLYNRTVDGGYYFYSNDWRYGSTSANDTTIALFQPNKSNPYYYFTEDTPVYVKNGDEYEIAGSYVHGTTYYVLKKYFDQTLPGYLEQDYVSVDESVTSIAAKPDGTPYIPIGEHRKISNVAVMKTKNPTGTYASKLTATFADDDEFYLLGNNGRLKVELTGISVEKIWHGEPLSSVFVQLYADGVPVREPVELNEGNDWKAGWTELLKYSAAKDANDTVSLIQYNILEGTVTDGVFTPYDTEKNSLTGYRVEYTHPQWDEISNTWSNAAVTNIQENSLTIAKKIVGLPPEEYPYTLEFTVVGTDESEKTIFNETIQFSEFTDGKYILANLPAGNYHISENWAEVTGYTLTAEPLYGYTVELPDRSHLSVELVNTYVFSDETTSDSALEVTPPEDNKDTEIPSGPGLEVVTPTAAFTPAVSFSPIVPYGILVTPASTPDGDAFLPPATPIIPSVTATSPNNNNTSPITPGDEVIAPELPPYGVPIAPVEPDEEVITPDTPPYGVPGDASEESETLIDIDESPPLGAPSAATPSFSKEVPKTGDTSSRAWVGLTVSICLIILLALSGKKSPKNS